MASMNSVEVGGRLNSLRVEQSSGSQILSDSIIKNLDPPGINHYRGNSSFIATQQ